MKYLPVLYRLALALWFGGAALFTFVLTPLIFKGYDRDAAGAIIGVIIPGYFYWGMACGAASLLFLAFSKAKRKIPAMIILAAMLSAVSYQALFIEPKAAQLKKEIPSFVTTPPEDPKRQEFKKLHGLSMGLNLGVIGGGGLLLILL